MGPQSEEEGEDFQLDSNMRVLDLSSQNIEHLEPLISLVFSKTPNLVELDLSDNLIQSVPDSLGQHLTQLETINLNGNPIPQDDESFMGVVDSLSLIGPPGLKVVYISLTREDQVDFILRKLPKLEMLNGLAVDREELYSSGEESREDEHNSGERQEKADFENAKNCQ